MDERESFELGIFTELSCLKLSSWSNPVCLLFRSSGNFGAVSEA